MSLTTMTMPLTAKIGTTVTLSTGSKRTKYKVAAVTNGQVTLALEKGYGTGITFDSHYTIEDFERRTGFKLDDTLKTPAN